MLKTMKKPIKNVCSTYSTLLIVKVAMFLDVNGVNIFLVIYFCCEKFVPLSSNENKEKNATQVCFLNFVHICVNN